MMTDLLNHSPGSEKNKRLVKRVVLDVRVNDKKLNSF